MNPWSATSKTYIFVILSSYPTHWYATHLCTSWPIYYSAAKILNDWKIQIEIQLYWSINLIMLGSCAVQLDNTNNVWENWLKLLKYFCQVFNRFLKSNHKFGLFFGLFSLFTQIVGKMKTIFSVLIVFSKCSLTLWKIFKHFLIYSDFRWFRSNETILWSLQRK